MHPDIKKVLITHQQIVERSQTLAQEIDEHYQGQSITCIGLLKGSIPFLAELIKHIQTDLVIDFMDVSSYDGTESIGDVKIVKDLEQSIKGDYILLIEDIVDTGKTIAEVKKLLFNKGAKDVKVVTLLDKPSRRINDEKGDFIGFEVPNEFVVGFGLDYNEKYRQLDFVGVLKDELYQ